MPKVADEKNNQSTYIEGKKLLLGLDNDLNNKEAWLDGLDNKWFRLNTLYDIKTDIGEVILFEPNEAQTDLFLSRHNRDITLKARQLGFTTFEMIDALDDCLFKTNFTAACIAHTVDAVKDIFDNKVKFAYESINRGFIDYLTDGRFNIPTTKVDRANAYKFSNGSKISVGTSFRSGTLQKLHVSEFGKTCKKFPEKAKEIVTGSFEAVSQDGRISIESTAEGREGYFYDFCEGAKGRDDPAPLQFKLHFYAWHEKPAYTSEHGDISASLLDYFDELEFKHGVKLTNGQKRWYSAKKETLGDDIFREHPSTPEEAFKVSIEGAYYAKQFLEIYKQKRIGAPLNDKPGNICTAWDIGTSDSTSIWFYHRVGNEYHVIDYYENSNEGLEHYLKVLDDKGYDYLDHYAPHDMDNRQYASKAQTLRELAKNGLECEGKIYKANFTIVPKIGITDGIQQARDLLKVCYFYEEATSQGVKCLEHYRKEWDTVNGCWKDNPKHDWSSHGADAFRYLAVQENRRVIEIKQSTVIGLY